MRDLEERERYGRKGAPEYTPIHPLPLRYTFFFQKSTSFCFAETKLPRDIVSKTKLNFSNFFPFPTDKSDNQKTSPASSCRQNLYPLYTPEASAQRKPSLAPRRATPLASHPTYRLPHLRPELSRSPFPPSLRPTSQSRITWGTCSWAGPRDTARAAFQVREPPSRPH